MALLLKAALGGFLAAIGFGVLYNIQDRITLLLAGMTGGTGTFIYQLVISLGGTELSASFYGAIGFTLLALLFARIRKTPSIMYSVPALIPLVPGGTVFKMMNELLTGKTYNGLNLGIHALAIAGMLVFGMTLTDAFISLIRMTTKTVKTGAKAIRKDVVTVFNDEVNAGEIPFFGKTSGKTKKSHVGQKKSSRPAKTPNNTDH